MKLLDHSISHTRRALCAATLAVVVGAITASAQSSSSSSSTSNPGATSNRNYGSSTSGSAQNSTTSTDSSRRNNTSNAPTSGSTSGSGTYSTGTRSGSSDANYGGSATTSTTGSMSGSTSSSADKLSWGDKRFVTKAGDHGQAEVQIAQLATQQASNPEVRRFAQRLVTDHTRVNSELMSLASNKNVKLDQEDSQDRTYRRLSNRQGQEFDQEFIEQMIDMHEADIKLFEKASEDAKDQEIRSFASRHIGHLREHLQQAQSLRSTIMPTGRASNDASVGGSASTSSTSAHPSGASDSGSGAYQTTGSSHSGSGSTTPGSTSGSTSGSNSSGSNSSGSTRSNSNR